MNRRHVVGGGLLERLDPGDHAPRAEAGRVVEADVVRIARARDGAVRGGDEARIGIAEHGHLLEGIMPRHSCSPVQPGTGSQALAIERSGTWPRAR